MPVPLRLRLFKGLLASLLIAGPALASPLAAAEVLELRFDGLELPVNLEQLDGWTRSPADRSGGGGDLAVWLDLLDPRSRLVMVEGGSHFSPVRLMPTDEVLFRLDEELVGVDPARVQSALLRLTTEYLQTLEQPLLLPAQRRVQQGVTLDVLDAAAARRWKAGLKR